MFRIADEHIDFVLDDLYSKGIRIADLRQNLLDHVCILAERDLSEGDDFKAYYRSVIPAFYHQSLGEIEEETQFLLRHRRCFAVLSRLQCFVLLFILLIGPIIVWTIAALGGPNQHNDLSAIVTACERGFVFALFPLTTLLVIFLTPDRFDPLIPRGSRILLGWKPFIDVIPRQGTARPSLG
ncbi:MAG TPA: hypothetical protein VNU72_14055 [Puia sp.]|jgi:hypothetical protein|nr:hypothetical protein [Puia sp.]